MTVYMQIIDNTDEHVLLNYHDADKASDFSFSNFMRLHDNKYCSIRIEWPITDNVMYYEKDTEGHNGQWSCIIGDSYQSFNIYEEATN